MITYRLWHVEFDRKRGMFNMRYSGWREGWYLFGVFPLYIRDKGMSATKR